MPRVRHRIGNGRCSAHVLLSLERGNECPEELVDVLLIGAVDALAVVRPSAGSVLADHAELDEAAKVGLEQGDAEGQAPGEFTAARRSVENERSKDSDADPVAEDVDGSFHVLGKVGAGGGRHGVIVVGTRTP